MKKFFLIIFSFVFFASIHSFEANAVTNKQIVPFDFKQISEKKFFIRNGLNLQNGRIIEVPQFEGQSFKYCRSVTIRAKKDVSSKKVTVLKRYDNLNKFSLWNDDPDGGWISVFQNGKIIGYAAKAIKKGNKVNNLFCPAPQSKSSFEIDGRKFGATLRDKRHFQIISDLGKLLYSRKISGDTPLYELRSGGKPFGWMVGWHKYEKEMPYADFTVVRVLVPFTDAKGKQQIKDFVFNGLRQKAMAEVFKDIPDTFTFAEAEGLRGFIFNNCFSACTNYYYFPKFIDLIRSKGTVEKVVKSHPDKNFVKNQYLSHVDLFLLNFKYDNWNAVRKLFKEKIRGEIEKLNDVCRPEIQKFLAAIKQPVNIPKWTKSGYEAMLKEVWGDRYNPALNDLYYEAMVCVPYAGVFEKVIGVLNLPPDADLIEKILDAHVQ